MSAADTIVVGANDITRTDDRVAHGDRNVHRSGRGLQRPMARYVLAPDREPERTDVGYVPDARIGNERPDPVRLHRGGEQIAELTVR